MFSMHDGLNRKGEINGLVLYLRSPSLFHAILCLSQSLISGLPCPSDTRKCPMYCFSGRLRLLRISSASGWQLYILYNLFANGLIVLFLICLIIRWEQRLQCKVPTWALYVPLYNPVIHVYNQKSILLYYVHRYKLDKAPLSLMTHA